MLSLALTVILLIRKKCSVYGAIALGLAVFMGLFLLDTAVGIRYWGIMKHAAGHDLTLDFTRMFRKSGQGPVETLSNIAVFVPFGFFLGEWLALSNRTGSWRRVGLVTLAAFGLSLCIECLQLLLHVGFFEVTDLVMNTVGGSCRRFDECGGEEGGGGEKASTLTYNWVSYERTPRDKSLS